MGHFTSNGTQALFTSLLDVEEALMSISLGEDYAVSTWEAADWLVTVCRAAVKNRECRLLWSVGKGKCHPQGVFQVTLWKVFS